MFTQTTKIIVCNDKGNKYARYLKKTFYYNAENDFIIEEDRNTFLNYLQLSAEELDKVIKAVAIKTNE